MMYNIFLYAYKVRMYYGIWPILSCSLSYCLVFRVLCTYISENSPLFNAISVMSSPREISLVPVLLDFT